jgi:hypothetical protein
VEVESEGDKASYLSDLVHCILCCVTFISHLEIRHISVYDAENGQNECLLIQKPRPHERSHFPH